MSALFCGALSVFPVWPVREKPAARVYFKSPSGPETFLSPASAVPPVRFLRGLFFSCPGRGPGLSLRNIAFSVSGGRRDRQPRNPALNSAFSVSGGGRSVLFSEAPRTAVPSRREAGRRKATHYISIVHIGHGWKKLSPAPEIFFFSGKFFVPAGAQMQGGPRAGNRPVLTECRLSGTMGLWNVV